MINDNNEGRTMYSIHCNNLQLERLAKLADDLHRVVYYKYTGKNLMSLSEELTKLVKGIEIEYT